MSQVLAHLRVPGEPRRVREAAARVRTVLAEAGLAPARLADVELAVGEVAANAAAHGNAGDPSLPVEVDVAATAEGWVVRVTDAGAGAGPPDVPAPPDVDAVLAGDRPVGGWGLVLTHALVDEVRVSSVPGRRSIELLVRRDAGDP